MKTIRRDLGVAAVAASTTLGLVAVTNSLAPIRLVSQVFEWRQAEVKKTATGERRAFFDGSTVTLDQLECHATTVKVGEASHPPHQHPDEELVIVKEGTLEVTINGKVTQAGPGSLIFYSSNDVHGMRNVGDTPATYHVLRWTSATTPRAALASPVPAGKP